MPFGRVSARGEKLEQQCAVLVPRSKSLGWLSSVNSSLRIVAVDAVSDHRDLPEVHLP